MQIKDGIVSGILRVFGKIKAKSIEADSITGPLTGNANTATKLATARTISLSGDATGSASFDGSANSTITVTVADSSHNHTAGNITGGTLGVARGGTGNASWTANRIIYPSASTTLTQMAFPTTAGSVLRQGTSGAPYWTTVAALSTEIMNYITNGDEVSY